MPNQSELKKVTILDTLPGGDTGSRLLSEELSSRKISCQIINPREYAVLLGGNSPEKYLFDNRYVVRNEVCLYRGSYLNIDEAYALSECEKSGTRFLNTMENYVCFSDKMKGSISLAKKGYRTVPTIITNQVCFASEFIDQYEDIVLKAPYSWDGDSVFRVTKSDVNRENLLRLFIEKYKTLYLQKFISTREGADIRTYIVGGKYIGAVQRRPFPGHFLSNLSKGGELMKCGPSKEVIELTNKLGMDYQLDLAGVDIRVDKEGPVIIEVNPDPEWKRPEDFFGLDITIPLSDYIESLLKIRS